MADDWIATEFGQLADSISVTHSFGKEQLIFLNTSDIQEGKILHRSYSPVTDFPGQAKKTIRKGDILFSEIRPANGRYAFVDFEGDDYVVSTKLMVIRARDHVSPRYLYHFLTSRRTTDWLQHLAESRSGTFPQITFSEVAALSITLPSDETAQDSIADFFDALNDKIELNRRMNETLEAIARAIFKSWFVDFDPIRAKASGEPPESICRRLGLTPDLLALFPDRLVDSELGEIPEGWETRKVEKLLSRLSTKVRYTKDEVKPYGVTPVFEQGAGILLGYHDGKAQFEVSSEDPAFIFGDHTCVTYLACEPFDISQNVIPLKGSDRLTLWVFYAVKDKQVFQEYRRHWMELIAKDVVVAPERICAAFTERMTPMHLGMEANVRQNHSLAEIRDALLPKLISGELRMPIEGAA